MVGPVWMESTSVLFVALAVWFLLSARRTHFQTMFIRWQKISLIEKKLVTFSTWVVLISIGTRLFGFRCTLCFTLGFLVLRRRTNGYHAKTYIKCLIVSLLIECGSIFVVQNISMERLVFIIIFSNLTIFKFAPVNNEQIHLTVDEMNAMKKEIRKVLIGMDILCLLCIFCHTRTMGNGLVAALAADAITLVAADLHKTKER